jgi:class 3 adenylate cyclase
MTLRTTVLMKTDIAGSTARFRALLAADHQSLLSEHRTFVARHAADYGGQIVKSAGDGYWLEYPSVTSAAKSVIAMLEAVRLGEPSKGGGDRLSMRIVIGLGDVASLDDELIGDLLALMVRIEGITPADEIYLTLTARHALAQAEVQTAIVDNFPLKGFPDPIPVYHVEQRHRTHVIADAYILFSDLRGFTQFTEVESIAVIERLLDALDALVHAVANEFEGTIRFSVGDGYCLTFAGASQVIAAAERLALGWDAVNREGQYDCGVNIAVHRGKMSVFRSFLYGEGMMAAGHVQAASAEFLPGGEGGVFVTSAVRDDLADSPWQRRLQPVALSLRNPRFRGLEVYRLGKA